MDINTIYGYHGLPHEYVSESIAQQAIHPSTKDNEWLGHGVYFFKYISDAKWWLSHDRYIHRTTAILRALLTYTSEQLLDLDDPAERERLEFFYNNAVQRQAEAGESIKLLENPSLHQKWCFVCNLIRAFQPKIGVIIYTFPAKDNASHNELFPGNRCQICVSDQSIISEIKEVTP